MKKSSCTYWGSILAGPAILSMLLAFSIVIFPAGAALSQTGPSEREEKTILIRPEAEKPVPRPTEKIVPGEALPGEKPKEPPPGDRETLSPIEKIRIDELNHQYSTRTDQEITLVEKDVEQEAAVRKTGITF